MKYQELTAGQLTDLDRENSLAILPIAAVEQHGPHMPTGTDTILCTQVAEAVESKLENRLLLLPTLWLGASAHHLRFGATLDASLENHVEMLCDVGRSLFNDGFKRLVLLNGHGGNIDPMKVAVRKLQTTFPGRQLVAGNYWSVADKQREDILEGEHRFVGHACEFETSLMLYLRPDLVDTSLLSSGGKLIPDHVNGWFTCQDMRQRTAQGFTGRPDLASAEKGRKLFESIVEQMVSTIQILLSHPLSERYEDFLNTSL